MVKDCTTWLGEVESRIPTVLLVATDATGGAHADVTVSIDGASARKLDGTSWEVDPGQHTFTFHLADGTSVDKSFLVFEGQKDQRVVAPFGHAPSASALATVAAPVGGSSDAGHGRRVLGLAAGSVGLAGVVIGAIFGGLTFSAWSSVNRECPTHNQCLAQAISDHDSAVTFGTASDVGFIAGGAFLAGGLVLYLTAPKDAEPVVGVRLVPGGLGVAGRF
jgi:hypothetical protein